MRQIKFRAWDNSTKKMYYNSGLTVHNNNVIHMDGEIMQFTGLKDNTGKEIYEGDIVKSDTYNILKPVFWGYSGWEPFEYYMSLIEEDFEVIGNIYEHPDLLK